MDKLSMMELSVALIAVAFAVLVVYLIITLKSARASFEETNRTLGSIREKLDELSEETAKLIQNTNEVTEDLQGKMKSLDTLFASFRNVSDSIHEVTTSAKQVSASVSRSIVSNVEETVRKNERKWSEVMDWATFAFRLYHKWKAVKAEETTLSTSAKSNKGEDLHVR